jgi:DNA (cytosine-5)-methyltransferase 1
MLRVLDLFSGIGGFSLGLERTGGFETVAFCEIDPFCQKVLAKHWPGVPCHEDITTAKGLDCEVITGGFPCQDVSIAGNVVSKREGLDGERSGLWSEYLRLIGDIRPKYAVVENVTDLLAGPSGNAGKWFGQILSDLAGVGYDAEWHYISASSIGAPQNRGRVWIIAYPCGERVERLVTRKDIGRSGSWGWRGKEDLRAIQADGESDRWPKPLVRGVDDGVSNRTHRLRALGNAVVPQVVEQIGHAILAAESERTA